MSSPIRPGERDMRWCLSLRFRQLLPSDEQNMTTRCYLSMETRTQYLRRAGVAAALGAQSPEPNIQRDWNELADQWRILAMRVPEGYVADPRKRPAAPDGRISRDDFGPAFYVKAAGRM